MVVPSGPADKVVAGAVAWAPVTHTSPRRRDRAATPQGHAPAGDGTLRGLRSRGPIAVSASIISRFGLRLGGSSTGRAVLGTVVGSIIPSITLTGPPACASSEVLMYSIMASSSSSVRSLIGLL